MYFSDFYHSLPLTAIYCFSVLLVLCALGLGMLLGHRHLARNKDAKEPSIGSAVAATLGLLAFLLAFTFNMTAERFSQRKSLLLDEVNAIYTTYLRADFLSPAGGAQARALLAKYVDLRDFDPSKAPVSAKMLARSEAIHRELWLLVEGHIRQGYDADTLRLFVDPLNQVLDLHTSRVIVGVEYRIPAPIWAALYFMTILAMVGIGFQLGASSGGSLQLALVLALTFATAIILIADLDRTDEGVLAVDQTPMSELNRMLQESERRAAGQ